jgi:hypothetical protein
MTGLPDVAAWTRARDLIARHTDLFADEQTRRLSVTDVHLVQRIDDDSCAVVASVPLRGSR